MVGVKFWTMSVEIQVSLGYESKKSSKYFITDHKGRLCFQKRVSVILSTGGGKSSPPPHADPGGSVIPPVGLQTHLPPETAPHPW